MIVSPNNPKLQMEYYSKQPRLWRAIYWWFLQTTQNFKLNFFPHNPDYEGLYLDGFSKQSKTSNGILFQTTQIMKGNILMVSPNNQIIFQMQSKAKSVVCPGLLASGWTDLRFCSEIRLSLPIQTPSQTCLSLKKCLDGE